MKIQKGPTIRDLMNQISHLSPQDRATAAEREKCRESLKRRCPYLLAAKSVKK